jgi:hypothetical protein
LKPARLHAKAAASALVTALPSQLLRCPTR